MSEAVKPIEDPSEETRGELPSLNDLLKSANPTELKLRLTSTLNQSKGSENLLRDLAEVLSSLEDTMDQSLSPRGAKERGQKKEDIPVPSLSIEKIKTTYDSSRLNKNKVDFAAYLYEYLQNRLQLLCQKYQAYLRTKEEYQTRQKASIAEKEKGEIITQLKAKIKEELLAKMKQRLSKPNRSAEDSRRIAAIEKAARDEAFYIKEGRRKMIEITSEEEILLAIIMEEEELFGEGKKIYCTDKADNYFCRADMAVEIQKGLLILIDITHSPKGSEKELLYNQRNPVRFLNYPTNPVLSEKPGLPIIIGFTLADAEEIIDNFLEKSTSEKLLKEESADSDLLTKRAKAEKNMEEGFERWIIYVLRQLKYHKNRLEQYLKSAGEEEKTQNYEIAIRLYEQALEHFIRLKKEHFTSIRPNAKWSKWDEKLFKLEVAGETAEKDTPPKLPDLSSLSTYS